MKQFGDIACDLQLGSQNPSGSLSTKPGKSQRQHSWKITWTSSWPGLCRFSLATADSERSGTQPPRLHLRSPLLPLVFNRCAFHNLSHWSACLSLERRRAGTAGQGAAEGEPQAPGAWRGAGNGGSRARACEGGKLRIAREGAWGLGRGARGRSWVSSCYLLVRTSKVRDGREAAWGRQVLKYPN